ncbi:MAG: nitronate monooxygenase [Crocinitomicaceae bacterium]|nr:nitronate monooxygenase [Crocinitomicaceae bacterium]
MNRINQLFHTKYPIVQAGMIWCSGWRLASAVSNAGALGLIGAGSMYPQVLREHIVKCKAATQHPFGVNIPLLYPDIEKLMEIVVEEGVKIVFTSAGNPASWTRILKERGIERVVHVVSSAKFAKKAEDAGCDAIVAEGFEAGGHNGREETTTFCLLPSVTGTVKIPVLAAGGIASGAAMLAAFALGAEGVQVGSRFVASIESSAHDLFKQKVTSLNEGETQLTLKELTPVRMIKNEFFREVEAAYAEKISKEELAKLLGRGRAKRGMFEGNMEEGELEIGQIAATIRNILSASEIIEQMIDEFYEAKKKVSLISFTSSNFQ